MKFAMKSMAAVITFAGLVLGTHSALAGCGPDLNAAGMKPMIFRGDGSGGFVRTNFFGPWNTSGITGLWKFAFTAKGNQASNVPEHTVPLRDDTPVDSGFVTWHDDGTELMNSGRAPVSGSFCMGVWKQVGPNTYRLNHWALSWIPAYQPGQTQSWSPFGVDQAFAPVGPTNIQEEVTLNHHGDSYSGVFRLTQYLNDGKSGPITDAKPAAVVAIIFGTVSGTRIDP